MNDVFVLYKECNVGMTHYIKGNFTVIIYDNYIKELVLVSSKLNTLPLFYYYKDNNFIFSSSMKLILKFLDIQPKLNEKALIEHTLFYYPLFDKTYYNDILQLSHASILKIDKNGLKVQKYWHTENLLCADQLIPEKDALCACSDLMKKNLRVYTSDADKFLLSLTAGFDSRTNLALLERDPKDFLCYSYGMPGSKQIEIPLLISKKLGLNYKAIHLGEAFEKNYEDYALKVLDFSDGTAPILRANFPYVFAQLSNFSRVNITGLFGSEILKPFSRSTEQISPETIRLFMSENFDAEFNDILRQLKNTGYIRADIIDKYSHAIKEDFEKHYIKKTESFDKLARFYIFLLEEATRKYFMQEIRIESHYVETLTPYLDEEFLELIFKTPFLGMYKGAGETDIFSRINSQLFYAKIIQMANPVLGDIVTDRGYKPKELLLPFIAKALKIGPVYLKERARRRLKGNDTFRSELWSKDMVTKYVSKIGNGDEIFTDKLIKGFENNINLKGDFRFFSIFSLRLWMALFHQERR
ncbi:MAG: hypothetical protein WCI77_04360 [Candidatus Omnitrophota bacterium]